MHVTSGRLAWAAMGFPAGPADGQVGMSPGCQPGRVWQHSLADQAAVAALSRGLLPGLRAAAP